MAKRKETKGQTIVVDKVLNRKLKTEQYEPNKKDKQYNGQKKKGQTTTYKRLHIKLKIE